MRILLIGSAETNQTDRNDKICEVDSDITDMAKFESAKIGKFLKENGFNVNKFFVSPMKSSFSTGFNISKNFNEEVPVQLMIDLHELVGINKDRNETNFKGLNKLQILENFPNLEINEDLDDGWWKEDTQETETKFFERVKKVIVRFKEMAVKSDDEYTVCIITHSLFLNCFFSILTNTEILMNNLNFGFANLSLSSFSISKKKEVKIDFLNLLTKGLIKDE